MSQTTVIIGFAEALSAPEVAWSLVDAGFTVMAFTRKGRRPSLRHSRFVSVFEITAPEENFAQTIADLKSALLRLKEENSESKLAVMPLDDASVWLCSKIDFSDQAILVGPRGEAADLALDKRKQIELARAAGFSVPEAQWVNPGQSAPEKGLKFPVVFKLALAAEIYGEKLGRGRSWVCADQIELDAAFRQWADNGPMLLQEFVPGVGEGLFGLASNAGVSAWSGHRRVRMMNPQGSGSSACEAVPDIDQAARTAGERFLAAAGWRGLFMIELLRDRSGKLWFIEFNGRAWGSMALARRGGLEYPAWAVRAALAADFSVPLLQPRDHALLCRHLARETLYLLFVLRGSKSKALHDWPSIWKALFHVVRIGRHDCWYNWRRDDPRVFVSDWFGTLRDQFVRPKYS